MMDGTSDRVTRQTVKLDSTTTSESPFAAVRRGSEFIHDGFTKNDVAGTTYYAPDADALLDDAFFAGYCFRLVRAERDHPTEVGLGFTAAAHANNRVDIDGVLWVDTTQRQLRRLEFRYVGLDRSLEPARPGGQLSFHDMANGVVIIDRWSLRLPVVHKDSTPLGFRPDCFCYSGEYAFRSRVDAQETGGEVAQIEWPSGLRWDAPLGTLHLTLFTHAHAPAVGTRVWLDGTSYLQRADSNGEVTLARLLPGPYELVVIDTLLEPLGITLRTPIVFEAMRDSTYRATLDVPTANDYVADRCADDRKWQKTMPRRSSDAVWMLGRVVDADSQSVAEVSASVSERSKAKLARSNTDLSSTSTGTDGIFELCPGAFVVGDTVTVAIRHRGTMTSAFPFVLKDSLTVFPLVHEPKPAASPTTAQKTAIVGVAFDSLHSRPLANAFVTLSGISGGATTDESGHFRFENVPVGKHTLSLQHELLDSIGLPGLERTILPSDDSARIAIPSFPTLWGRFCAGDAPHDTGVVFGRVTDSDGRRGLSGAALVVGWADLVVGPSKTIEQQARVVRTRADTAGRYAACGVPISTSLQIRAAEGPDSSAVLDLFPNDLPMQRRDIRIGRADETRGVVAGMITASGSPAEGVRIVIEGLDARSTPDGKFVIRNVPAGTRQIELTSIGMKPAIVTVDVAPRDTGFITYDLQKVVELSPVKVIASEVRRGFARDYELRKREGFGTYLDSNDVGKHVTFASVLQNLPALQVRTSGTRVISLQFLRPNGRDGCAPTVMIDGLVSPIDLLSDLTPDQIATMEYYDSQFTIPADLGAKAPRNACGLLAVWTKRAFP
jgi:hypothetical protein